MKQLVQLEIKKINMKSVLAMGGAASGILFLYLIISGLLDWSTSIEMEPFLCKVVAYNKAAYTLFIAVLIHKMFSEEIAARSFSILFTYPISRMKLLLTKILLMVLLGLPFMMFSMLLHFSVLMGLNTCFHYIEGTLNTVLALKFIFAVFIQSLLAVLTAFIPLYVDVKFASTQYTIISAGVMALFLYSMPQDRLFSTEMVVMAVTAVLGVLIVKQSLQYIARKDII